MSQLHSLDIQLSQNHLLKRQIFFHWFVLALLLKNQVTMNVRVYFQTLSSIPYIYMSICLYFYIHSISLEKEMALHYSPSQYSCLGNPMDRGAWRTVVHGGHKELDTTEWLTFIHSIKVYWASLYASIVLDMSILLAFENQTIPLQSPDL